MTSTKQQINTKTKVILIVAKWDLIHSASSGRNDENYKIEESIEGLNLIKFSLTYDKNKS